jgi:hypothetical protein
MRELTQIDSPTEHECSTPSVERWNVFEPISGQWSWLVVYACCARVVVEPDVESEAEEDIQQAA